ncbi:MAG: MerR family transcriptional regulator [Actinomycetota bacterium]|nr:MerR family transcriptional regulator [Actinomycetota bacterium]
MNIEAVARRTGVPAATLRKWEERYGVPSPARTDGAQRRYSDRDIRQIEWLRDRLAEGIRVGHAVRLLQRVEEPVGSARALRGAILDAVRARAQTRAEALVTQAFALYEAETAISEVAVPVLVETGALWERGELSVADEHFVSQLFSTKLRTLVDATASGSAGVAVLACVPGERHELGLLSAAVLLQGDGWRVAYLGQDTPLRQAFALAADLDATILGLGATISRHAREAAVELGELGREHPRLKVVRGGAAFGAAPARQVVRSLRRLRRKQKA